MCDLQKNVKYGIINMVSNHKKRGGLIIMIKTVGKFIWRIAKCVIGAAVVCFAGYYVSVGLNWLTGIIIKYLTNVVMYLKGNWVALLVAVAALVIGGICFDGIENFFKNRSSRRAAKKKHSVDYEE